MKCRHCQSELTTTFVDLGSAPPSNAYLTAAQLNMPEKWFPLKVMVCDQCWLVQTEDYADAEELFDAEYAYFSSYSNSWLDHARRYADQMIGRFDLTPSSYVVEVASNDGYLLQYFRLADIPCLGIEPTKSTAGAARTKGIEVVEEFFGVALANKLASNGKLADLTAANNVLAHVPDINDFVGGFAKILKPNGVSTFEFPHLMQLVQNAQFDTIYHEHFSYLSLTTVNRIFEQNGLQVFDVEEMPTHGGSLRVFAQRRNTGRRTVTAAVMDMLGREEAAGIKNKSYYEGFQARTNAIKDALLEFLIDAKKQNKKVVAYGAAAKGNTLLNYAGVRPDLLPLVIDRNPVKQSKYLPGSRIPIMGEASIRDSRPDYILILPWNLRDEVSIQLAYTQEWGAHFVTVVPELTID